MDEHAACGSTVRIAKLWYRREPKVPAQICDGNDSHVDVTVLLDFRPRR